MNALARPARSLSLLAAFAMLLAPALPSAADTPKIDANETLALMEKAADWQLAHLEPADTIKVFREETRSPRSWQQGAFYVGLTALADRSKSDRFKQAILNHGRSQRWRLGDREYHADDHVIGQSYLWAASHGAGPEAIEPTQRRLNAILTKPSKVDMEDHSAKLCWERWCWCDALFMAPPLWIELAKVTNNVQYAAFAHREWQVTQEHLYDPDEHLFFRDRRFFQSRDSKGRKLFWSRGNGWVFAGLARVLTILPNNDPARPEYQKLFKEMAAKLKTLQKPDGYWPSSLLGPENSPPESSGTGFFVYGLAWGINAGLLDHDTYEPTVARGWHALEAAVDADGRLGWVQQVSDRPEEVSKSDTQFYGVGALLLAGSAVHDLYK